jgi:hypothetical protein
MKKLLLLALIFFCGCIIQSAEQSDANQSVKKYVEDMLGNPKYIVPVSFSPIEKKRYITPLDSSLNLAHIKTDEVKKMEQYVDSENYQRPDRAPGNIRQLDSIKKNKLFYYSMEYAFRIDSFGHKKLKKYHFELDSTFQVLKAVDVTYGRDTRQ